MNARKILSLVGLGVVLAVLVGFIVSISIPRTIGSPGPQRQTLEGTLLSSTPAPNFRLKDQFGRSISLSSMRGRVVVVTFFYTHCPDTCPLTSEKLRNVVESLGPDANRVSMLAVTTDPSRDTPALARRFLREHGLVHRWHFLLGKPGRVAPVWSAYHIYAGSGSTAQPGSSGPPHSAVMYLIDRRGRERVILDDTAAPQEISNDVNILLGRIAFSPPVVAPEVGDRAPDFGLAALSGRPMHLRRLRGKVVILNFWATWCVPCRAELPRLEMAYRTYAHRGLVILGIDQQETAGAVRDFVEPRHISFPILLDESGGVAYQYQIQGTPAFFFVDRRGVIRYRKTGAVSQVVLLQHLTTLLSA